MAQRRHLRSAAGHQLVVPSELMSTSDVLCTRSETVELSAHRLLRDTGHNTTSSFGHSLNIFFSQSNKNSAYSALGALAIMRYANLRLYLLTYLFLLKSPKPGIGPWGIPAAISVGYPDFR